MKSNITILVIEDNPGDFLIIEDHIIENFILANIISATSFKKASEILAIKANVIDIVLLDLSLPDKSGEELVKAMLEISNNIPIIVLTGYADVDFSERSISNGIGDYLLKDELNATLLQKSIIYTIQRKKHHISLRDSERKYSDLFHLNPVPMWVFDLDTLAFLQVNNAAIAKYGFTNEEFLNFTIRDIRPSDDISLMESSIEKIKKENRLSSKGVYRHQLKNKEIIYVEIRGIRLRFNGRDAELVLASDISDRIAYTNAIEDQNKRLQEIAYTQSHIVRAPLARLMGLSNLMKSIDATTEEFKEMMSYFDQSATELDLIIKDIVSKTEQTVLKFRT